MSNAADKKQIKKRTKEERQDLERFNAACLYVMADLRGSYFVWDLLERCGIFRSSFTGNSETFMREGERNIGLGIMADIEEAAPIPFIDMWMEHFADARQAAMTKLAEDAKAERDKKEDKEDASEDNQE